MSYYQCPKINITKSSLSALKNVGVARQNTQTNVAGPIIKTADPSKIIAVIKTTDASERKANGNVYATGDRISEAYAVPGKELTPFMDKNRKIRKFIFNMKN